MYTNYSVPTFFVLPTLTRVKTTCRRGSVLCRHCHAGGGKSTLRLGLGSRMFHKAKVHLMTVNFDSLKVIYDGVLFLTDIFINLMATDVS